MSDAGAKPDSTQLALDRTWLALERTLMAWVRTAASQISFGFTIYKFFQLEAPHETGRKGLLTPRDFAIIIVSLGVASLFGATIQHRKEIHRIMPHMDMRPFSLAGLMSWFLSIFGIAVLISAIIRR